VAGRIRDEDIAIVRERSPIDEVVGEYLQLKNAGGGSLKGLCPFHDEKTPSFNVTPPRGLWYCFSCADGGDVIKFIERIDNLSFREAVERLAVRAGIELTYEQGGRVPGQEQSQRRRLLAAHQAAAEFYAEQLVSPAAAPAREFLSERGFELADAQRFGAGYAPAEWEALTRHLRARGFTDAELLLSGLASQGRRGPVDRFRGRLVWPVRDLTGDVIAFGARRLAVGDDGPKYLNTPETPLFRKSSVLYGADMAKREIMHRRQAVIVEGYTDVMACHLAGVPTAVATCGTSFGEGHVKVLRRLLMDADWQRGELIFTFDGDAAGQRAARRAFELEERFVTQTYFAIQGDGLDPCDLRVKHGDAAVRDLVASRVPLYEFAIRGAIQEYDLATAEGRVHALDATARFIARIKDDALRKVYAYNLDRWLGLNDQELVLGRIAQHLRGGRPGTSQAGTVHARQARRKAVPETREATGGAAEGYDPADPVVSLERQALKLAVQHPAMCGPVFDSLGADDFAVPAHSAVRLLIADCGGVTSAESVREWAARLSERALDSGLRDFIIRLAVEPIEVPRADGEPDARFAAEVLARVEELAVTRRIVALKSRLQRMNPVDEAGYNRMFGDLIALEQRRKALVEKAAGGL
jgi:DNA primase